MFKNIHAALFDLDGTLIDSLWVWEKIDIEYLKKYNINPPKNLTQHLENLSFDEIAEYFKKNFNIKDTVENIKKEWNAMALYYYSNKIKLKPGAKDLLILLKSKGLKLGICTSNFSTLTNAVLKSNNVYDLFDTVTTADEIPKSKNSPDIYLITANKLKVSYKNCLVFEDILQGIISAKSIGMKTVGVYDVFSECNKNDMLEIADKYINKFNELIETI